MMRGGGRMRPTSGAADGATLAVLAAIGVATACATRAAVGDVARARDVETAGRRASRRVAWYAACSVAAHAALWIAAGLRADRRERAAHLPPEASGPPDAVATEERERRLRTLFDYGEMIVAIDGDGVVEEVNAAVERVSGYPAARFIGRRMTEFIGELRTPAGTPLGDVRARLASGETVAYETSFRSRGGAVVELAGRQVPIIVDGALRGAFAVSREVTAERAAGRELAETNRRVRQLYLIAAADGGSGDGQIARALELGRARLGFDWAYLARVDGAIAFAETTTGTRPERFPPSAPVAESLVRRALERDDLVAIDDVRSLAGAATPAYHDDVCAFVGIPIKVGGAAYGALGFVTGSPRPSALAPAERDFVRLIGALVATVLERRERQSMLDVLAFTDPLTGLPNRRSLYERITALVRAGAPFGVYFVDLDGFKAVNDGAGHAVGDEVLRAVGERLRGAVCPETLVARLGGDEFVLVAEDGAAGADVIAESIVAGFAEPFAAGGAEHAVGASIGIARYPADGADGPALVGAADEALYRAKSLGRNRVERFRRRRHDDPQDDLRLA